MSLRPGGVSGISILLIISGVGSIIYAIVLLTNPWLIKDFYDGTIGPLIGGLPLIPTTLELSWLAMLGYILIPVAAVLIIAAIGLYKLKKWGYWLTILISIPLIVTIIGIIFIWYLRKEEVKAAFDIM